MLCTLRKGYRTARNNQFQNTAIVMVILTLVTAAAIAIYIANRPVAAAESNPSVPYSNALEMQYARPWLEAQNKPVVSYGNALELEMPNPGWIKRNDPSWSLAMHRGTDSTQLLQQYGNALRLQIRISSTIGIRSDISVL